MMTPVGTDERLAALLRNPEALVHAFDSLGAASVPVPDALGVPVERQAESVRPLDLLDPAARSSAGGAVQRAPRHGHGVAGVNLDGRRDDPVSGVGGAGGEEGSWLEVFDVTERHGCFLAVFLPRGTEAVVGHTATTLAPRRAAFELDVTGVIEGLNPAFTEMLGWTADDLVGESALTIIHPDDHEAGIVKWVELIEAPGNMTRIRQRFRRSDGTWLWCDVTDRNELDDPDHPRVVGEIIDVTSEIDAEAALQRRETMLDRLYRALPTGVLVLDADGTVAAVNDRWTELVGPTSGDPIATLLDRLGDRAPVAAAIETAIADGRDHDLEVALVPGGPSRFANLHLRPLTVGDLHIGLLLTFDDTTERKLHERELAMQMRRDPLTGVLNRRGVDETLSDRLASVDGPPLGVMYLDVDDFKSVNDHHGHAMGDRVLCDIAETVASELGEGDVLGRIGGDEFLVITDDTPAKVEAIARRVRHRIRQLSDELALTEWFGVSIGCAHRHPGDDFDSLVGRADASMYEDKARRRRAHGRERRAPGTQRDVIG